MQFIFDQDVKKKFSDLRVGLGVISDLGDKKIELFEVKKETIYNSLKEKYSLEALKDLEIVRAYRDFFWALGIDPTKNRPASEALIRRVLKGKSIPRINCVVDAYNLASMESGIALAAFDAKILKGDVIMRFARAGENFLGIGMKNTITLKGNELILTDRDQVIAVYPYRDADNTKVEKGTKTAVLLTCGFPGIKLDLLKYAAELAIEYITQICGGKGSYQIFG